jgi:hypothetical protein
MVVNTRRAEAHYDCREILSVLSVRAILRVDAYGHPVGSLHDGTSSISFHDCRRAWSLSKSSLQVDYATLYAVTIVVGVAWGVRLVPVAESVPWSALVRDCSIGTALPLSAASKQ